MSMIDFAALQAIVFHQIIQFMELTIGIKQSLMPYYFRAIRVLTKRSFAFLPYSMIRVVMMMVMIQNMALVQPSLLLKVEAIFLYLMMLVLIYYTMRVIIIPKSMRVVIKRLTPAMMQIVQIQGESVFNQIQKKWPHCMGKKL